MLKDVKYELINKFIREKENKIVKFLFNEKEYKSDNYTIGDLFDIDEINVLITSILLTDEIKNDDLQLDKKKINNFSKYCKIHYSEKDDFICLTCGISTATACHATACGGKTLRWNNAQYHSFPYSGGNITYNVNIGRWGGSMCSLSPDVYDDMLMHDALWYKEVRNVIGVGTQ